jgi:dTDP-4-amino-4,6-dideoxygalactose transaminase
MTELAIRGGEPVRSERLALTTPVLSEAERERVGDVIDSSWITTGPRTEDFESRLETRVGADNVVGVTNCSSALYLAYRALDLSGEVITSPVTFATTVSGIQMAGATPVLADVKPDTFTLDPESVKEAISDETDAIVPVHYAGQAVDMDAFRDLAADHDLALIEDAAHGLGGQYRGNAQGTLGDVGCYSFHPTKSITTAEGGALITDDDGVADTVRRLRLAGVNRSAWERDAEEKPDWYYDITEVSGKFNMTDVHAAIGLEQLDRLDKFIRQRRTVAERMDGAFADVNGVEPLSVREPGEHARHLYPLVVDKQTLDTSRREFEEALNAEGIDTGVYYLPIHHHSAFEDIARVDLSTTDDVVTQALCLPLHPRMDESDADDVVTAVTKVVRQL